MKGKKQAPGFGIASKWYICHNANRSPDPRGPVCVGGEVPRNLIKGPPQSLPTLRGKEQRRSGRDGAEAVSSGAESAATRCLHHEGF